MSVTVYVASAMLVFVFAPGCWRWPGSARRSCSCRCSSTWGCRGAGRSEALLLNVVSLMFATITYWRAGLINVRLAVPMLVVAVALAPVGARVTPLVDQTLLAR